MYVLIKVCLRGQDGNQECIEEEIGVFKYLEDAIDSYKEKQHDGWLRYFVQNKHTERIIELPIK